MATIHQAFLKLKNGWGQSLRWRVLTGFLTTLLVFLGLQGYLALRASYTGIQDQIAQSNRQLADLAIHGISAKYDAILQQVVFLRADLASHGTALDQQARDMLDFRRNWPLTYRALYLFDDEGQLLIHLTDPLDRLLAIKTPAEILNRAPITPGADVLDAWRAAGDRGGAFYVSPVRIVGADQLPVITLGMALASPEQPVSGARRLVVEIDLRDIWRGVDKFYVGQTGREFITSADGLIIAHPDRAYIGQRLPPALQPVLAGQGGQVEYLDPLSNRVMLAAFMPVSKQSGWGLIIEQQQSEALLPATRILAVSIGIMLAASALATFIALWLSRSITRPILHLAQVTQLIARTGDLHQDVAAFGRRDEIGQLALAFNQMIASLRQTEAVLRDAHTIIERSPAVAFLWKNEDRWPVEFVSKNVETLFGYTAEEFISGRVAYAGIIHAEDLSRVGEEVAHYSGEKGRRTFTHKPYRIITKDGQVKWIDDSTSIRRDERGGITHYEGIVIDITARKQAEDALRDLNATLEQRVADRTRRLAEANTQLAELDRLKDDFISRISHELRTPLTSIKIYLEMLDTVKPEKRAKYMQVLTEQTNRLQQLIESLLEVTQQSVNAAGVHVAPTDLNHLAASLAADLAPRAAARGLTLTTALSPELPFASADAISLAQVLSELATNALNYTPAGGTIALSTAEVIDEGATWITFTIRDTGPGVAPDEQSHIFERFYRGRAAADYTIPGAGLGLATSRDLLTLMEGRLTVDSRLGEGAAFTAWLKPA